MKKYQEVIQKAISCDNKNDSFILKPRDPGKKILNFYFLNKDHSYRPCRSWEWAQQFCSMERTLAKDHVNDYLISTVWLGLNHNYGEGKPELFETMVFKNYSSTEEYLDRYTTWDEAVAGHQKAIEWVKNGLQEEQQ